MTSSKVCRLCFSATNGEHFNLFSDIGIELKMSDIIAEHFKCDVNGYDSFPNVVCQKCWSTTSNFHELYQKSQYARHKFLESLIKVESDVTNIAFNYVNMIIEPDICEEPLIDVPPIKMETNPDCEDILATEITENIFHNVSMDHFVNINDTKAKSKASISKKKKKKKIASMVVPRQLQESQSTESFICHICQKCFSSKILLKKHVESHTKDTNNSTDNIREHYKKFIAENFDMTCDHCGLVLTSLRNARFHYRESHDEDMGYIKCCNIKLNKQYAVLNHINSHLSLLQFKCDCCNKNFASAKSFNEHKSRQSTQLICDMCGKKFRTKEAISNHFVMSHQNVEPKFECDICHKRFKLLSILKNHKYSVHREKKPSVTCEICGRSFALRFYLDTHMRTHSDKSERLAERKQCEHCGEWLMSKSGIYYHKMIHTSGSQKCNHCDTILPNKISLAGHMRKHHRERKYKCGYCEKTFTSKADWKLHEEYHTRHNQYPCQFCDKVFTVPGSRLSHYRRCHLEQHNMTREQAKQERTCLNDP